MGCSWKVLEVLSGMTPVVFPVDGPRGTDSSPGQNNSSASGVGMSVPVTHSSVTGGWGQRARDDNQHLILIILGARGCGPGRRMCCVLWRKWSIVLGICWVWSAYENIYISCLIRGDVTRANWSVEGKKIVPRGKLETAWKERGQGSRGRGRTYIYGWFMLMYGRNHHTIVKQLSSN